MALYEKLSWPFGALVLASALACGAAAAETWNMPVPYGDNNFHTLNHLQFAEDVKDCPSSNDLEQIGSLT